MSLADEFDQITSQGPQKKPINWVGKPKKRTDTGALPLEGQLAAERGQGGEYTPDQYRLDASATAADKTVKNMEANPDAVGDNRVIAARKTAALAIAALRKSRNKTEGK